MAFSWVSLLVEAIVGAVCVVIAFEYDRFRNESGHVIRWPERLAIQYAITVVITALVCHLLNRRARLGDDVYSSSYHTSGCIDNLCFHSAVGDAPPPAAVTAAPTS